MIKIYRILVLIWLAVTLTSCSNTDQFEKTNENVLDQNLITPAIGTTKPEGINPDNTYMVSNAEIEISMLEELINGEYKLEKPTFVDTGRFKDMDYMLLVKEGKEYFTNTDLWYEYALIGGECDTYEKGKNYYDEINKLYEKKQISINSKDLEKEYREGVIRQFYERHITAFSADGEKVLLKQYIAPFKSEEILYEVYKGVDILRPFLYQEIISREHVNYTTNLEYFSLCDERYLFNKKNSFYKTNTHGIIEYDMTFSISIVTDEKDTVYYIGGVDDEGQCRIMLYSISENELIFESDLIKRYPDVVTILEDKIIVGYYSNYSGYIDYFEIDVNTNESKYLFTNEKGVFSPDGKYLAYADDYTSDDGPVKVEKGYYIYCVDTSETAFFLSQVRDRENDYYVQPDRLNNIICWASKDGLGGLLNLTPNE